MRKFLNRFIAEEDGAELIEYALVVGIVAILCGAVFTIATIARQKIDDAGQAIGNLNAGGTIGSGGGGGGSTGGASGSTGDAGAGTGVGG